jgi:hypothetical protein
MRIAWPWGWCPLLILAFAGSRDSGRELAAVDPETLGMIWPYWPDPSKAGQACLQYPLSAGMMSTMRRGACHGGDLTEVDRSP